MTDAQTALDLLLADRDEWTIHAATLAGRDADRLYLAVVRSKVGTEALLLSLRYYTVDVAAEVGYWGDGLEMRVNGPLHGALAKAFLSIEQGGFASEQGDVTALDVTGAESGVAEDPDDLLSPLSELPEAPENGEPEGSVECMACGEQVEVSEALEIDMGGNKMFRHRGTCDE